MQPSGGSLRERRRARTHEEIADAARELFAAQGYDGTTVAEIAERAGVGLRTFYRYFPTKEHVAVDHLQQFIDDGVAIIEGRSEDEHPLESILAAIATLSTGGYEESLALDAALVETIPAVAGVQHQLVMASQDRLTALFERRLGSPAGSIDGRLCAVVCTAAYQAGARAWLDAVARREEPPDIWALATEAVERLGLGLRPAH